MGKADLYFSLHRTALCGEYVHFTSNRTQRCRKKKLWEEVERVVREEHNHTLLQINSDELKVHSKISVTVEKSQLDIPGTEVHNFRRPAAVWSALQGLVIVSKSQSQFCLFAKYKTCHFCLFTQNKVSLRKS